LIVAPVRVVAFVPVEVADLAEASGSVEAPALVGASGPVEAFDLAEVPVRPVAEVPASDLFPEHDLPLPEMQM